MEGLTRVTFAAVAKRVFEFHLEAFDTVHVEKDRVRAYLVYLNHDRNVSAFQTIRDLADKERVADIYTLSRTMFDSVITMGLLSRQGLIQDDTDRYQHFQFVDILKRYDHMRRLGVEHHSGVPVSAVEFLKQKRDEYVKKWGKNADTWTGKSLVENLKLIDEHCSPTWGMTHFYEYLYCQVYRTGSSLIHSSFAGLANVFKVEKIQLPGINEALRFKADPSHLSFSALYSVLVFLSSVRFLGNVLDKKEAEDYHHDMSSTLLSKFERELF